MKFKIELDFRFKDESTYLDAEEIFGDITLGGTCIFRVKMPDGLVHGYNHNYGAEVYEDRIKDYVKEKFTSRLNEVINP